MVSNSQSIYAKDEEHADTYIRVHSKISSLLHCCTPCAEAFYVFLKIPEKPRYMFTKGILIGYNTFLQAHKNITEMNGIPYRNQNDFTLQMHFKMSTIVAK